MGWHYEYVVLLDSIDLKKLIANSTEMGFVDTTDVARKWSLWDWKHEDEFREHHEKHEPTKIGEKTTLPEAELKESHEWFLNWLKAVPEDPEVAKFMADDNKQLGDGPIEYRIWLRKINGAVTVWWTSHDGQRRLQVTYVCSDFSVKISWKTMAYIWTIS